MMQTLKQVLSEHKFGTDKQGDKQNNGRFHSYLDIYEKLFNKFKDEEINILEIGVLDGESLKLWDNYFTKAAIWGIDNFHRSDLKKVIKNAKNCKVRQVNSFEESYVFDVERKQFFDEIKDIKFHIIIDDACHLSHAQIKTFNNFVPKLHSDGVYIIEDIMNYDGHLESIKKELPDVKIVELKPNQGETRSDNILGLYGAVDES